jgi:hypothetical protein
MRKTYLPWAALIGLLVLLCSTTAFAAWATPAAPKASANSIQELWRSMYEASFVDGEPGCNFDYGPQGMRNVYCYVVSKFQYRQLVKMAPVPLFSSGPHTTEKLTLDAPYDFGRYNPEFVKWMEQNLIPDMADENFRWVIEPVYNRLFRDTARVYYLTHMKIAQDPSFLRREVDGFERAVKERRLDNFWHFQYSDFLDKSLYAKYLGDDYYFMNVASCAVAFWIRRESDGTRPQFAHALETLVSRFDPTFHQTATNQPAGTGQPRPRDARLKIKTNDRMLDRFLDSLTTAVEKHDWDMVLTLFDPQNYIGQKKMGIGVSQYIEEGLGLGMVDNHLVPRPGDGSKFTKLNAIETMEITKMSPPDAGGMIMIDGRVTLFDGSQRRVTLYLMRTPTGGYSLSPPVG